MTARNANDAFALLSDFLRKDPFYLASSKAYGDMGAKALRRAIKLFQTRPELGFIWLAYVQTRPVAVCVVSFAISTSIGGFVAKLDDVYVTPSLQRSGVASRMLEQLARRLASRGVKRIDTSVYADNRAGEAFYDKLGFRSLGEERLAWVLPRRLGLRRTSARS